MHLNDDGLTVGELSIAIATLIVIVFIWTNVSKNKGNEEVSMVINNSNTLSQPSQQWK